MLTRRHKKLILEKFTKGFTPGQILKKHPESFQKITATDISKYLYSVGLHGMTNAMRLSYIISLVQTHIASNHEITDSQLLEILREEYGDLIHCIYEVPIAKRTLVGQGDTVIAKSSYILEATDLVRIARSTTETKRLAEELEKIGEQEYFSKKNIPPFEMEHGTLLQEMAFKGSTIREISRFYESPEEDVPGWLLYYAKKRIEQDMSSMKLDSVTLAAAISDGSALHRVPRVNLDYYEVMEALKFYPHAGQKDFLDIYTDPSQNARFCVLVAGRRFGKTVLCSILVVCELLQPNASVVVIAPNYRNAEIIFGHVVTLVRDQLGLNFSEKNMKEKKVKLETGATLTVVSSENADSVRGFEPTLTIFEEAASIKRGKKIFEEIISPGTSTAVSDLGEGRGRVVFISTPVYGSFLEEYYYRGLTRKGQASGWRSWKFPSDVNPIVKRSGDMEEAKNRMSEDAFAREYLGEWAAPEGTVFEEFSVETHLMSMADFENRSKDIEKVYVLGIDPGFTHPWATVLMCYLPDHDEWWAIYSYKLPKRPASEHSKNILEFLTTLNISFFEIDSIFYDYAQPQAIADLQAAYPEWWANLAIKNVDSGMNYVKELLTHRKLFIVEENCGDLITEFLQFSFKESRSGNVTINKIQDDCLDALRYAVYTYAISVLGESGISDSREEKEGYDYVFL